MLMQVYADVTGREIAVAGASQASALGAAMLGAVAAGSARGGYESLAAAATKMAPAPQRVYQPIETNQRQYDVLYREYKRLYYSGSHGDCSDPFYCIMRVDVFFYGSN